MFVGFFECFWKVSYAQLHLFDQEYIKGVVDCDFTFLTLVGV